MGGLPTLFYDLPPGDLPGSHSEDEENPILNHFETQWSILLLTRAVPMISVL